MTHAENTAAKATCCRSDLRFLLSLLADSPHLEKVEGRLRQIEGSPTNEQLNAAWKLAAIIHEQIRKQNEKANLLRPGLSRR